ncbi:hypothetical protein JVX90_07100 [Gordonia sp. PDNC005]|uniref:hypothetical protein n=1 Tax=unclassified Gordonia (in: high G+C Gram-positive bacteria) TaxID=2657482 RepID=UPI0019645EBE|nr:hypothetical protein [Gordonia sp. PDNC005]QRY63957.1 hypothetical protein JVX90_07100 [Gordonia sp. PDNC005]
MTFGHALATAATFLWLGMVLVISFIEAPLKFRAPGITIPLGLGIGRLVFRALNAVEAVWSIVLVVVMLVGDGWTRSAVVAVAVAVATLMIQMLAVRPPLNRRSDAVLAEPGDVSETRSHAHLWYVGLEVIKVVALVVAGASLLSA